jgi:hypothetical protein
MLLIAATGTCEKGWAAVLCGPRSWSTRPRTAAIDTASPRAGREAWWEWQGPFSAEGGRGSVVWVSKTAAELSEDDSELVESTWKQELF